MSTSYNPRYFKEPKQNDIKYKINGKVKLLLICLDYQGTQNPLTCIIDGKRIMKAAKKSKVSEIVALFDDQSTELFPNKNNVIKKMGQMAASCKNGDVFIVYYSGHGTSIQDQNNDQQDGFDEAFCLMNQNGEQQYLTDDQTSKVISKNLPDNIPCLFIVDACHSGSILDVTNEKLWKNKKIYTISGCQDNQYSNDTGNGGQMTNVLLEVLKQSKQIRSTKQASLQYIFNRMVIKNQDIEGNYEQNQKRGASNNQLQSSSCQQQQDQQNEQQAQEYYQQIQGLFDYNDQQGEHEPVQDEAVEGQWINLSWNGGSDPTKVPFPF